MPGSRAEDSKKIFGPVGEDYKKCPGPGLRIPENLPIGWCGLQKMSGQAASLREKKIGPARSCQRPDTHPINGFSNGARLDHIPVQ